jgi:hypothetical protein
MRPEVLIRVIKSVLVFWVVKPCGLVGRHQHFTATLVYIYKFTQQHNPEHQHQYNVKFSQ